MISLEEAEKISKGFHIIPISKEIMSDIKTPMQEIGRASCRERVLIQV